MTLLKSILSGLLRHALTFAGGWFVASGYLTSNQAAQGVGYVLGVLGLGFSVWSKWRAAKPKPSWSITTQIETFANDTATVLRKWPPGATGPNQGSGRAGKT
jgi:hypothetical protein